MANHFDQYDSEDTPVNYFDKYDGPTPKPKGGFINAATNVAGSTLSGTGHVLKDIGLESVGNSAIAKGKEIQDNNPAAVNSLSDIAKNPGTWVAESAGGMAGQAGEALAGGVVGGYLGGGLGALTGPLAPVAIPALSAAGAYVGGNIPMLVQEYGSERDQQIKNGIDDKKRALAGAAATTAIENLGGFKPGGMAGQGKKIVSDLAGKTTKEAVKTLVKKGVKSGVSEGLEEIPQQYTGAYGGGTDIKDLNTTENAQDAAFGAAMAFPGGAMFGSVNTVSDHYKAKRNEALDQTASTGPLGNALASGGLANTDTFNSADGSITDSTAVDIAANSHASSYDQLFQQAENNYGLPAGLLSTMGFHESGFDPNAVSSAGARGVMQFMPATAQEYGIDPHDTPAAINAAGKKMSGLINYYKGDISKAIAAYNFGEGNVDKTIARAGNNWQDELPPETQVYLSRILGGQEATTTQANTDNQYTDNADQISNYDQSNDQQTLASDNNNSLASGLESINTLENPYLSTQVENQNGSQKTDESTNETSTQEKGSLLNTDAPEQSGVTSIVDNAPHDPLVSVIDRNTGTAFNVLQSDLESDKNKLTKHSVKTGKRLLTPILRQDIVDEQTYQQELADQQKRQNEQTNQQTETQAQDQTSADQSTNVAPINAAAPLLNKRTNKPFKTQKLAEAAIASSSNPTLNKQDHIAVPVDGGFGIAPKPNTTQESNDTTAETQSVLSNTGTNAKGITAPATTDATGQGSTQTAQEVDKQPWQMTHDEYWKAEDKKYEANRLERLAKVNNELDTLKNKGEGYDAIIAKEIDKVPHTITNDGKFSHNLRSGSYMHNNAHDFVVRQLLKRRKSIESSSGRFRNSFVNDNKNHHAAIQKAIDEGQSIPKNVLDSLPSNFPEFKSDATAQATENVAPAQEVAKKPDWEMTRDEYKNSFDPRDYKDSNYDRMIRGAVFNEKITQAEADKKLIRDYHGNKYHWAKTRKELEQEKKEAVKNAKAARAEGNKNPIHSVKWAQKSESNTAKNNITSTNLYHNKLLEVHQERVQEALSEGKPVPQEVLADYPNLQKPVQETANPIHDNADVSKKGENVDITHAGQRIYQKDYKEGTRFLVETNDNKERRLSGDRNRGGDSIFNTLDEAKNYAEEQKTRDDEKANNNKNQAEKETIAQEQKVINDDTNGFADQLKPHFKALVIKRLNEKANIGGTVDTIKNHVKSLVAKGELPNTQQEDKVKEVSRTQFNRMNNEQQQAHALKIKEAGKKTVYRVGGYDLGKTAYEYAGHLVNQKQTGDTTKPDSFVSTENVDATTKGETTKAGTFISKNIDILINNIKFDMHSKYFKDNIIYDLTNTNKASISDGENFYQSGKRFKIRPDGKHEEIGVNFQGFDNKLMSGIADGTLSYNALAKKQYDDAQAKADKEAKDKADRNAKSAEENRLANLEYADTKTIIEDKLSKAKFTNASITIINKDGNGSNKVDDIVISGKEYHGLIVAKKSVPMEKGDQPWWVYASKISIEMGKPLTVLGSDTQGFATQKLAQVYAMRMADAMGGNVDSIAYKDIGTVIKHVEPSIGYSPMEYMKAVAYGGDPFAKVAIKKDSNLTTKGAVIADKAENIQDFGEKLEGAKKFTYTFKEALSEDIDISAVPLSKSFPQPDYEKLIAGGIEPQVAALIAQLRAEIPTKPSKSYRVSKWAAQVTAIREAADQLLSGKLTVEQFIQAGKDKDNYTKYMGDVLAIADSILPSQIRELGNFKLDHTLYVLYSGVKDVWKWSVVNTASKSSWGKQFDTKEEAVAYIKSEISTENTKGESIAKFDRWTERGKPGVVFVGKKIASGKYITLKEFPTSKEALNYTIEHNAELVELLKQKKKDKEIRRAENNQRVGKDYRNGKNVSAKEFTDTFGFRGVQFGNWVENDRRQQDLNNAYDGLIDLAEVLGIPPKALALNGELGLAFGARGTGGEKAAAAHYEANQVVINLTKAHGAGSLAHEWWHAVDNYFGKQEGSGFLSDKGPRRAQILDGNKYRESTDSDFAVRKEVFDAWQGITKAIKTETQLARRSAIKDKTRSKDYYSTVIEMTARTFERYIIGKLADQGYENDYLANIIPAPILEKESELDNEDYAYPLQSEMAAVNKAYDKLFDTLETKETEKGTALFSKSTTTVVNPHSKTTLNQAVTKAMDTLFGQGWTNRLMATGKFKMISRDEAVQIAGNQAANAKGFYNSDNDTTYLVHDNIEKDTSSTALVGLMLHEISTHSLNLGKSNEAFQDILRRFEALKATNPKVQAAFANVPASAPEEHKVEEALAEYLQANPKSSLAQRIIEWFRQAVRALGKTLPVLERAKFSQWANKLTEAELIGMATSALKSAPDSLQFDNVGRNREGIKLSGDNKKLLAPNGKPSNLNAMQHAQVRTEAFKKWFGDWLYNPEMEMTPINLVDDPNMPIDGDAKSLGTYLLGKYRNLSVINAQSGNEISIYRVGLLSSLKNRKPLARRLYAILPQLLEQSAYAGYEVNTKLDTKPNIIGYESFYAPVSIDGKIYSVRILVDRVKDDARGRGYYYHQIEDIALGDPVGSTRGLLDAEQGASPPESSNGVITLGQLTGKVNNNASKVVDENGEPLVVYHGTDKSFDSFDIEATAQNRTGNPTGIYLTPSKDEAKYFGSNVFNLFAIAVNPYIEGESKVNQKMANTYAQILKDNYPNYGDDWIDNTIIPEFKKTGRFKDIQGAFKTRVMKAGGFDSWKDGRHIDVFGPNQIKSATENNGDFSQSNNNIKFSRSTPSNTPADNSAMRSFFAPAKGKQALGWLAGFFQRNHLIDFVAKDLPELINYKLLSQEKDNFTNQRENEIGKSYKEMMDKMDKKTMHELGRVQGMATRLATFSPVTADYNTPMTEEERAVYDAYSPMPKEAKEVYVKMRKDYQDDLTEKKEALIERIKAFPADKATQAEIIRTIEEHFDQFKEGDYFPLNRDGAVIVKATNQDGELVIEHVATQAAAYKLIKEMQDQGYENTHILGKDAYDRDLLAGNAANEMAALAHRTISDLKEKSVQGKLTDADFNDLFSEFNQLLINTLPDSSYRKHFIHRKGTLGESTDTLRAYAKTRTSAVKMIASLTYDHQIQAVLNDADKTIKEMDKVPGSDTLAIKSILNELKLREAALKSTEINAMSQVLTSLGFMGALGFNIASAAVNMLQVMGVALPELSGRHSEIEAIKEISAAYKLLFNPANLNKQSGFDITKNPNLPTITKQAIERLKKIGKIDLTMTHDAIAMGKNPSYSSNLMTRSLGSAAKYSGYFFHVAEAANRQITGMAAFNLAYQKNGGNFEAAIAEAVDVIDRTQFDYGQGNRARYMMSNTARVLTLFKAYALGMSYYIGRNAYQSMKGETPEVRLQARKTLVVSMAMSFATAGLFGMPIGIEAFAGIGGVAAFKYKGAYFAVPGAIGGMLIFRALLEGLGADDDDELETEFRNWLTDNFDQTTAEWVTKGPARLLPIGDISGRTSLSELWWRSQNKQLEGTDQYNAIATALIGPIGSQIAGLFTAKKMYEDGQYSRMVESMSPAFMRNAIAATRMSQDGVRNLKGDKIIERDLTPVELINKVIGFNPTVVTNTYDANSAIAKESTKHTLAKSHLVNRWLSGDATERSDLMKGDIKDFNESVSPSERITLKNLFASMKARKGIDKHTQNGLYLSKKQNYLRDIGRFNRQE